MISYLRGRVLTTTAETVILDVNGVGYEAYCSGGAFKKIVQGEIAELYTYLQVKEDGVTLFGFESPKEKELFLKLISVSGVGPKMGISILASLSAEDFAQAVATADVKRLSAVKGLGKKTPITDFTIQGRGGKGVMIYKPSPSTGDLVGAALISDEDSLLLIGKHLQNIIRNKNASRYNPPAIKHNDTLIVYNTK